MKKIILALAVILVTGLSSASASIPVDVSKRAVAAFHADFKKAKDVKWVETPKYVQATFSLNDKIMFAYYQPDGNFIGVIRNILTSDLPVGLRKAVKKDYKSFWVSELFQMDNDQGITYYMRLDNGDETVILQSDDNNGWKTFSMTNHSGKQAATL